jgi:dihydroorotase
MRFLSSIIKDVINTPKYLASWAEKKERENGSPKPLYTYLMSFYYGNLLPKEQIKKAKEKKFQMQLFPCITQRLTISVF